MRRVIYILARAPYLVRDQGHAVPGPGTRLPTTLGAAALVKLGAGTAPGFSGFRSQPLQPACPGPSH